MEALSLQEVHKILRVWHQDGSSRADSGSQSSRVDVWSFSVNLENTQNYFWFRFRPSFSLSSLLHLGTYFPVTYWVLCLPTGDNDV